MIGIMKSINKVAILTLISPLALSITSCDDAFEPAVENHKDMSQLEVMPQWAAGLLGHAYISNPLGENAASWSFDEVATDDAVSNDRNNAYMRMAYNGAWRSDNNPKEVWTNLRASWQYINQFIEVSPKVQWAADPVASQLYDMRLRGDAYGMRALYMYHLLRNHAGWSDNGELLGIPILTESESVSSNFNLPRNTFKECLAQLEEDVNLCVELLPDDYGNISGTVPAKYAQYGANVGQYNRVFGDHARNRMNPKVALAVLAQAKFLAASPAFSEGSDVTWADAANSLASVLKNLGNNPVAAMDPTGNVWYADEEAIVKLEAGYNRPEFLWRSNKGKEDNIGNSLEGQNFAPTLYGNGRVNPSQNLVDAFPMANGLPIDAPGSGYDSNAPYANRDPRLDLYIIHNKSVYKDTEIITAADGDDDNALNKFAGKSTRTGYYLKKFLVEDANANPSTPNSKFHIKPWIRYTEIFLSYAEAANEAWGPRDGGSNGFSAYDVIKAIRQRAGITGVNGVDQYLETCANNKDEMRKLIRNERRLELCFEGFRFWDLRRWKANLNEPVKGMRIENDTYTVFTVDEERSYKDYMYYGPVPYGETLKFDQLKQNAGWD